MDISVIVPIYYGKQYIKSLISQIEDCKEKLKNGCDMELILVNDAPDDPLEEQYISKEIEVVPINTDYNRGIHGARIRGLEYSRGEFVLFLDQDDRIEANYMKSQLEKIGSADAVVCRCIHEKKQYYNVDFPFEKMITKEYMLTTGCPIISPGQVLFCKESIPEVWKENIMQTNCADDYLLYLCMVGENKQLALNQEILFEHVVNGANTSWDAINMIASEQEMVDILKKQKVFEGDDLHKLNCLLQTIFDRRIVLLTKFRKMFFAINKWMELKERGILIGDYLYAHGMKKIAIYGAGYLGKRLKGELENSQVTVAYYIDRNAEYINEEIEVFTLEMSPKDVDAVIVTLVQGYDVVVHQLEEKFGSIIYTLNELESKMEELDM